MTAAPSAHEFEKQLAGLAYSAVGKQPPAKSQAPDVPLVPIYVGIDTEQPPQQLREVGCRCRRWCLSCRPSQHLTLTLSALLTVGSPCLLLVLGPHHHTQTFLYRLGGVCAIRAAAASRA